MKIAISSDEYQPLIDLVIEDVKSRGHEVVYFGPSRNDPPQDWPEVTSLAIDEMKQKKADQAIVLCWTGTGCTLIANKGKGIRAALCVDAETARGAKVYNHANVLGLSLRLTSPAILSEILDAWFNTPYSTDEWNLQQIRRIELHEKFR